MPDVALSPVPDAVPARMVNEYAYCPRLAYLEWVQGDWADNADTAEGRYKHRAVDQPGGALPAPDDDGGTQGAPERIHARSVWLSAEEEHLTARIDLIEGEGTTVTPVDYKRGSAPDLPEGAWETDRVQLCAQGLILRANGYTCDGGVVYYAETKTRVPVPFDDALIARTRALVRGLREMAAAGRIPPPLVDSPKCVRCSLAPICLPDEVNLLNPPQAPAAPSTPRRLMPARDDAAPLYVQEPGARVSKSGELFEVWLKDARLAEARIFETSHIALFGSAQITTPALGEALDRGIAVAFFSMGGWFKGMAHGPVHKNVALRMAQYRTALDPERSLALARNFVSAKIRNCRTLLMRNHADPPKEAIASLLQLSKDAQATPSLSSLLGIEGNAGRVYFGAFAGMLKPRSEPSDDAAWRFDFEGRNRRPPRDPVNALLSFAYSLLVKELAVTAQVIGFDPYLGFYHQPRYGRPSLALDAMEEFRPLVADSVVLTAVNTGVITPGDFMTGGPAVALSPAGRKKFIQAFENRLQSEITHPIFGYRVSYRRVLEVQLRLLGRVLSGEIADYPTFTTR
ncbi:MAG: CRISPR-associated exonuclease Cas4/endonuclease Cas1 fusion [Candidatus Roseilinea sp.]|nr:MAG: CRISPR-associated exonuclease Cas4/endonuclease Cas1 fusion [Candidatus Roseilinea sp.]